MVCATRLQMPRSKLFQPTPFRPESQLLPFNGLIELAASLAKVWASRYHSPAGTLSEAAEPGAQRTREHSSGPQHRPAAAQQAPAQQAHGGAAHCTAAAPQLGRMHQLPVAVQPLAAAPASGAAGQGGPQAWQQAAPQAAYAPPRQQQALPEGGAEGRAQDQQQAKASLAAAPQLRLPASNRSEAAGNSSTKVHLDGFGSQNEESPSQGSQDSRSEYC